ncbi:MAG: hypothetical protein HUK15_08785, partial [Bacteroidales bacterium]|nr:hypothetical protein [Bacteroidales bacterium]
MKFKLFTITALLIISAINVHAQANGGFSDSFDDGDFTSNPEWTGDVDKFTINGDHTLQLNDVGATTNSTAMLSTESQAMDNAVWQFVVKYDFDPSTSNFCDVYLASNSANVVDCTSGYFVRVCGASSTDNVCLYLKNGSTSTKIINGAALTLNTTNNTFKIKVERSASGEWSLYSNVNDAGEVLEGQVTDTSCRASSYFGVYCKYSKTRSTAFYFDDFVVDGTYYVDSDAPVLESVRFVRNNQILLKFNENLA